MIYEETNNKTWRDVRQKEKRRQVRMECQVIGLKTDKDYCTSVPYFDTRILFEEKLNWKEID